MRRSLPHPIVISRIPGCPGPPPLRQDATGIEDIDQLVNTFLAAEDQNYTLFNYVNEVNQEIEKLEDQINIMRSEINKYR